MPTGNISKRTVDALTASDRPVILWDASIKGFGIKANPSGKKLYIFQYRPGGRDTKTKRMTIGEHGPVTPAKAVIEAQRLRVSVAAGNDPIELERDAKAVSAKRAEHEAIAAEQSRTLAVHNLVDLFVNRPMKTDGKRRRKRTVDFYVDSFNAHILPAIGHIPVTEVSKGDIVAVLDSIPVELTGSRRNAFVTIRAFMNWAVRRYDIENNPIDLVEAPVKPVARDRTLSDNELRTVWRATGKLQPVTAAYYRLLIATGQRRNEVAAMEWGELDHADAVWTIPAGRTKNGKAHRVPLNPHAMDALDAMAGNTWPNYGYVLTTTGRTPISGFSKAKRTLDTKITETLAQDDTVGDLEPWRVHDLRRTLATGMQKLGVRLEVTEAVLNHVSGSKAGIVGIYQTYDWAIEKQEALARWSDRLRDIIDPRPVDEGKVTNLQAHRSKRDVA